MSQAPQPPDGGNRDAKDAAAFAGGCLAGLGAVGIVTLTVVGVVVATIVVVVLLIFLSCAGVFQ